MIKNLQITILILIIILSSEFIILNTIKKEKPPQASIVQKSENIPDLDLTTAISTTSLLSSDELKKVIDSTTAPKSKVDTKINNN
ncbi:MAG TPA: hypothetical protein VJC02_00400 [Candidatus Paceibacterota bacterium]